MFGQKKVRTSVKHAQINHGADVSETSV